MLAFMATCAAYSLLPAAARPRVPAAPACRLVAPLMQVRRDRSAREVVPSRAGGPRDPSSPAPELTAPVFRSPRPPLSLVAGGG